MNTRIDPHFYLPEFRLLLQKIKNKVHMRLGDIIKQANESWDQSHNQFGDEFPYIEISAVGLGTDDYVVEMIPVEDAPSRARMIVRTGDIIVSTTRPHRGAIARIRPEHDGYIASTGFAVLRELKTADAEKDYLLNVLISPIVLRQFLQRSSGGNYPAITPDEIDNVLIPVPKKDIQVQLLSDIDKARSYRKNKLAESDNLLNEIDSLILKKLGLPKPKTNHRSAFAVTLKQLKNNPLNAERYRTSSVGEYITDISILKVADVLREKITPCKIMPNEEWDWIRIDDISSNPLGVETIRTEIGIDIQGSLFEVREGDILLARLGPTILNRKIVICPPLKRRTVASGEFLVLRCYSGWFAEAVVWILRSSFYRDLMYSKCRGGTPSRYRLNADDLQELPFPKVGNQIQLEIVSLVQRNVAMANRMRAEAASLWSKALEDFENKLLSSKAKG